MTDIQKKQEETNKQEGKMVNLKNHQKSEKRGGITKKHLIFSLASEDYGVPLSLVKEVIGMTNEITPVPNVPGFFKGLINLRGKIISVIDLRVKLGLPQAPYEPKKTSIIITEIEDFVIGAVVDNVNEVTGFELEQIETDLDIPASVNRECIEGVAKDKNERLILLLDIGRALSAKELNIIRSQAA